MKYQISIHEKWDNIYKNTSKFLDDKLFVNNK